MKTYRYKPQINVIYSDGLRSRIDPALLEPLIGLRRIDRFERDGGWVEVGVDPIRGMGGPGGADQERRLNG